MLSLAVVTWLIGVPEALGQSNPDDKISINGRVLSAQDIVDIEQVYGVEPIAGSYWYDALSGAFGTMGGPVMGVMYPGHDFGKMTSDVSNGTSSTYINNRQLQRSEALQVAQLFGYSHPVPCRFWLLANGNIGMEGYTTPLGNIYTAMRGKRPHQGRSDNFWSSGLYSAGNHYNGANGQPSQGYVSVPGYGPISFGMN